MKVLNLYAGIGGNAKSFKNCDVTAVEFDPKIAKIYKDHYPEHNVIVGDTLSYLEENFDKFDFIWASPPCPTHSRARKSLAYKKRKDGTTFRQNKPVLPDMSLYSIITFLEHEQDFKGIFVVENVVPYYKPLIEGVRIGRHLFWSNIDLSDISYKGTGSHNYSVKEMELHKGFNLDNYSGINKRTLLRNAVDPNISDLILKKVIKNYEVYKKGMVE